MSALPIDRPGKIVCVGLNYSDHAEPRVSEQVDYEAELGVVIGERVRGVSQENALDAVRGYLCLNDVSARDLQFSDGQWTRGKSVDTFCPVGPQLVPASEVPDPQALGIRCVLNGELMQDSTTANMIFTVAQIIAYASATMTLEPGDLIATGTPAGVGVFRDPPVLMKAGDEVTIEIDGLGSLWERKLYVVERDASRHLGGSRLDRADDVACVGGRPAEVEDGGAVVFCPRRGDEDLRGVGCVLELAATAPTHLVAFAARGGRHRQRRIGRQALVPSRPVHDIGAKADALSRRRVRHAISSSQQGATASRCVPPPRLVAEFAPFASRS